MLGRLAADTRAAMLKLGVRRDVGPGEVLIRQGEVDSHVILLRHSLVKVTVAMADGREALLAIRISGDIVGEMSALNGRPRSASVTTCGSSQVSIIHNREFRPFLRSHPDAAIEIAGVVADRLRWANRRRVDFASHPVRVRLARVLYEIAADYGQRTPAGVVVGVRLTQPELATLCGAAEPTVQRALRELRSASLVSTGYRQITVLDLAALHQAGALDTDP
jgi:CRP-like cAMP-binding protein